MSDLDAAIRAEVEARRRGDAFGVTDGSLDDELYGGAPSAGEFAREVVEEDDDAMGGADSRRTGSRVGALAKGIIDSHRLEEGGGDEGVKSLQAAGSRYNHETVGDRETAVRGRAQRVTRA